ncbi:MAG: 30S ribosomal protein S17 [Planctomycetota bacterium]|jgi:small subunit ribosomal protein S17|nr:30S ribosomal protein S17 [Planctomycetota bacterium]
MSVDAVRGRRKRAVGVVVSDKMDKTISVRVNYKRKHPQYGKFVRRSTTYKAHDESGSARTGDRVEIMEVRPLSKTKRWRLVQVVEKAESR